MKPRFSNQAIIDVMEPMLEKRRDNLDELRAEYHHMKEALERGDIERCGTDLDGLLHQINVLAKSLMEDEAYVEGLKASL